MRISKSNFLALLRGVALSLHSSWSSEIAFTTTRGSNIATDQDKTFIIIILQVQFLGTQLAKKKKNASRGVPN